VKSSSTIRWRRTSGWPKAKPAGRGATSADRSTEEN
jgi:hypothetical protein